MPRVKTFMWKALSECLPVRESLGLYTPIEINCPLCSGNARENIKHLFTECVFLEAVWRGLSFSRVFYDAANLSFKDWCISWLKDSSNRDFISYVLCYVWKFRCRVVFDYVSANPINLVEFIRKDLPNYTKKNQFTYVCSNKVKTCDKSHPNCSFMRHDRQQDTYYVYFDASFQRDTKSYAYGIVKTDDLGCIIDFSGGTGWCSSSEEAESRTYKEAIKWMQGFRDEKIIFLNDNRSVMSSMKKKNNFAVDWRSKTVLQQAFNYNQFLTSSSFVFIKRKCNFVADKLTKILNRYKDLYINSRYWDKSRKDAWILRLCNPNTVIPVS
ncbi:uncharacterized protein LOC113273254 [Papaver somniferum]|uniref:uncharacterized protein LOC113273254 n=1 Tax=Papaver somniferum TaxID=3469 RepID=UPI000E700469|nr:uncharacterized protein LOC113273254 [Papaver somniferum]